MQRADVHWDGANGDGLIKTLSGQLYEKTRKRSYIALDVASLDEAAAIVEELGDAVDGYKVGLELFYGGGPAVIDWLASRGKRIFLDIKLHDIPTTVAHALRVVSEWPIEMVNVHASGGIKMLSAAREAVDASQYKPLLIGVTVLTSLAEADLEQMKIPSGRDTVLTWSRLCQDAGLDGVVTSALDVESVAATFGRSFVTVVPGTRPSFAQSDDQARVMTPGEAISRGAQHLVIGRAVTKAENRLAALAAIWDEMQGAMASD